jgi:nucleotide-binding universal stress UspA family protein
MVHAINSLPVATMELSINPLLPTQDEIIELERSMQEAARKSGASATAKVVIEPNIPGEIIIAAAREANVDLIVMGTHGRTGIKRLVLGSVAEHVLRHAPCPVVTVRSPKAE